MKYLHKYNESRDFKKFKIGDKFFLPIVGIGKIIGEKNEFFMIDADNRYHNKIIKYVMNVNGINLNDYDIIAADNYKVGDIILHLQFGKGIVYKLIDENRIRVKFTDAYGSIHKILNINDKGRTGYRELFRLIWTIVEKEDDDEFENDFEFESVNESISIDYFDSKEYDDKVIKMAQSLIDKFGHLVPKNETKTIVKNGVLDLEFLKRKIKSKVFKKNESWEFVGWTAWYILFVSINGLICWQSLIYILKRYKINKFSTFNNWFLMFINAFLIFWNTSVYFNKITSVDKGVIVATKYEEKIIYVKDKEGKYAEWKVDNDYIKKNKKPGDTTNLKDIHWLSRKIKP